MNSNLRAHLTLLTTSLVGGFTFSISKALMPDYVQPAAIVLVRGGCAIVFFWLIHSIFIKEKIQDKKDYFKLWVCSIFGITLNQVLLYEGLNRTSTINAAIFQCGVPIFVMIFSALIIKEKMTLLKISGLILGATGAVLLSLSSGKSSQNHSYLGDIFNITNAASYGVFLVLVKPLSEKYNPFTVIKWIFLFGTLMTLPYGYNQMVAVDWETLPTFAWLSLGFLVVFATFLNYYLNVGVLRFINPSIAGIYVYLVPVFATIIAILIGQDSLTIEKTGYILLIFTGVYLVSTKKSEKNSL